MDIRQELNEIFLLESDTLPDKLLSHLRGNKKGIQKMNKSFLKQEQNLCKNWKKYRSDKYECDALHRFIKDNNIVIFGVDDGGNSYGYSLKNNMIYYYDHELAAFPYLYLVDKRLYNLKMDEINEPMGSYVKKNYKSAGQNKPLTVDQWLRLNIKITI